MTAALFWGCMIAAFGVGSVVFLRVVANKAQMMLVMISGAFFWLVALMVSSIVWHILLPIKSEVYYFLPVGVLIQEGFRFLFFRGYAASERAFAAMGSNAASFPLSDVSCGAAAGLGFGFAQTLMEYGSVLRYATGPGTLFNPACPTISVFVLSAWLAFLFVIVNIFWMLLAFDGYRRRSWLRVALVAVLHLLTSFATLISKSQDACVWALICVIVMTCISGGICWLVLHNVDYRSRREQEYEE